VDNQYSDYDGGKGSDPNNINFSNVTGGGPIGNEDIYHLALERTKSVEF